MTVENVVAGGLHRVLRSRFSKQASVRHLGLCQGRLMDSSSLTHELSSFAVPKTGKLRVCLFVSQQVECGMVRKGACNSSSYSAHGIAQLCSYRPTAERVASCCKLALSRQGLDTHALITCAQEHCKLLLTTLLVAIYCVLVLLLLEV